MAYPKVKISDDTGNTVDLSSVGVTSKHALDVNIAQIEGSAGPVFTIPTRATTVDQGKVTIGIGTTEIVPFSGSRFEFTIVNDSDEIIYLGFGEDAVLNEGVRLNPSGGSFSTDIFTGAVDGICQSGSKNVTFMVFKP
jgi:hypothetical protein